MPRWEMTPAEARAKEAHTRLSPLESIRRRMKEAAIRFCPHCGVSFMFYKTRAGDYYCKSCRHRFAAAGTKPQRDLMKGWSKKHA